VHDVLEVLELPLEVYPEYFAGLGALFRDQPSLISGYFLIAVPIALVVIYLTSKRPLTFLRTYVQCFIGALILLPGAIGMGGLTIGPLALVLVLALMLPLWWAYWIYNLSLVLVAGGIAWLFASVIHRCLASSLKGPSSNNALE
jgi:hypothetical protein